MMTPHSYVWAVCLVAAVLCALVAVKCMQKCTVARALSAFSRGVTDKSGLWFCGFCAFMLLHVASLVVLPSMLVRMLGLK